MIYLKNFILVMIWFLFGSSKVGLYQNAYNYIKAHYDTQHFYWENSTPYQNCIKISSEVVPLSMISFFDHFSNDSVSTKKSLEVIDSLETLDKVNYFEPYIDESLSNIPTCDDNTEAILFFSKPTEKNTLLAILFIGKYPSKSFEEISRFNEGLLFLLFTKEDSKEIVNSISSIIRFE